MSRSQREEREERRYTSARERADKQSTGFSAPFLKLPAEVQLFKPKAGVMLLDIIPFEAGEGNPWAEEGSTHWERTIYVHRGVGANSDSYLCPRMTSKARCPICEHRVALMKESSDEELVKELAPKQRQLFNVINRKDPDKGVQLWSISYHLFGKVLDARLRNSDEEDGWEKFFFIEDGLTLKVGFAEKTFAGHAYLEAETIDFRSRSEPYEESIMEDALCLDELLVELEYDELKKIYLQTSGDEDEDKPKKKHREEEEDEPAPRSKKRHVEEEEDEPAPRKKHREEEDEDTGAPKRKPAAEEDDEPAPKKKPKNDDNWDDFDEDKPKKKQPVEEDEDEPAPKRKRPVEEDDDEPAPKKRHREEAEEERTRLLKKKPAADDWDDFDEDKPKKKQPVEEDEDEPAPKRKR